MSVKTIDRSFRKSSAPPMSFASRKVSVSATSTSPGSAPIKGASRSPSRVGMAIHPLLLHPRTTPWPHSSLITALTQGGVEVRHALAAARARAATNLATRHQHVLMTPDREILVVVHQQFR